MRLGAADFAALAAELTAQLAGARVQKVFSVARAAVALQLKTQHGAVWLLVRAGAAYGRLSVLEEKPALRDEPPPFQALARRHLEGAVLRDARAMGSTVVLGLTAGEAPLALVAVMAGGGALAVAESGRVRALDAPRGAAPPELLPGKPFVEPAPSAGPTPSPTRLVAGEGPLPLLRAAEAAVGATERAAAAKVTLRPLERKLARLVRTLEKVRGETGRQAEAEAHRRAGELLKRNLHRVAKGQREVQLEDYRDDGTVETVTLKLDPAKGAAEQVRWQFHQYKRLTRGAEVARERLARLLAEREALEAQKQRALAQSPGAFVEAPDAPAVREPEAAAAPFRTYQSFSGARIWVGKGPAQNDQLTFRLALPHHVWLHARGVGGAHVVVPLEKNAELSQDVLVDAAHLALHHSSLKGEPRGEVSWTHVRFVKKPKGVAPGLVSYTRDRTFWVRVEPDRLARLLSAEV